LTMKSWKTCTEHLRNKEHPKDESLRDIENAADPTVHEMFDSR
jgi:hypothetical protein